MTTPDTSARPNSTRNLLIGVVLIGVLLIAIFAVLNLRDSLTSAPPTPTLALDSGVTPIDPPITLQDFTLPSSTGGSLSLSDLQPKYTLLFFGYTHCPDICPTTLAEWMQVKSALGDAAADVNFVFVSVDPARDTPEALARFLSRFDPVFVGLSGDADTLARIGTDYGLYYQLNTSEGENYSVDHTSQTYLISPQGQMIDMFSYATDPQLIAQTIQGEMG